MTDHFAKMGLFPDPRGNDKAKLYLIIMGKLPSSTDFKPSTEECLKQKVALEVEDIACAAKGKTGEKPGKTSTKSLAVVTRTKFDRCIWMSVVPVAGGNSPKESNVPDEVRTTQRLISKGPAIP